MVPLTPIEQQFLSAGGPLNRFHQAIAVEAPLGMKPAQVQAALQQLLAHHDALRLKVVHPLTPTESVCFWLEAQAQSPVAFAVLELAHLSPEAREATINTALSELPGQLDPEQGRMVAGVWIERGAGERALLFLAIHHLVVDGVSWRILLEDLDHLTAGRALPARTHSVRDWAQYLVQEAQSTQRQAQMAIWREVVQGAVPLPCEGVVQASENVIGATERYESVLPAKNLEQLLTATTVYRTGIDDLLLTALGLALYSWRAEFAGHWDEAHLGPLLIDLEGHGYCAGLRVNGLKVEKFHH
jgi:hypothetical protein